MPIKGENIYKRKDQRWEGRYVRERRADGSIRYGYCYGRTYREVKQKLRDAQQNRQDGQTRSDTAPPKSSCGFRFIPLTEQARALCEEYFCADPEAFVLTGSTDRYVEPRTLQYRFGRYVSACGLEGVHFHTLRHTFATRCIEVDFEIKALSEIMGHASPRITLERYAHASMQFKRENMNKLTAAGL